MTCIAALLCPAKTESLSFPCLSVSSFFPFFGVHLSFPFRHHIFLFALLFSISPFSVHTFLLLHHAFLYFSLFQSTLFILLITILLVIQDC
ncbi:hypothetical protein BDF14DRAFT_1796909 [Spinellus fusiger]|nr:hypothetical protein BDF14DRAFT_1796909 [Spinellus fusiger]